MFISQPAPMIDSVEITIFFLAIAFHLPFIIKRCKGNVFLFLEQFSFTLGSIFLLGSFSHAIKGLEKGAMLFGDKLIFKNVFFASLVIQCLMVFIKIFECELHGYGTDAESSKKDPKFMKLFNFMMPLLMNKFVFCRVACVLGVPGLNNYAGAWLSILPLALIWLKLHGFYYGSTYHSDWIGWTLNHAKRLAFIFSNLHFMYRELMFCVCGRVFYFITYTSIYQHTFEFTNCLQQINRFFV